MKKRICFILAACMLFALAACANTDKGTDNAQPTPSQEPGEWKWTREGIFEDADGNMLSVTWMEDVDEPGWYVGCMIGDVMAGASVQEEGKTLYGDLNAWDESADPYIVTVSEEGEDGLLVEVEGGGTYHFTPMDLPEATIFVHINVEGMGNIDYAEGENPPEIDTDYPYQSAQVNLAEPGTYTFEAWPSAGSLFVKWTKNGEDFSTEPVITVLLDESADYVAVFEEDPDWQNPVMNFIGEYQCGSAHALVETFGYDEAWITIEWVNDASEIMRWDIEDRFDPETLTVEYTYGQKSIVVYDEDGEIESREVLSYDGTGTVVFHNDGTFTWHDDQSESGEDLVFVWMESDGQNPVMNFIGEYQCDRAHALVECFGRDDAQITIEWGGSAWELARWEIFGYFDADTLTVEYSGCVKTIVTYDNGGNVKSEEIVYDDGTGTIVFHNDGTFTWHEDQSESGEDLIFVWAPTV